MFSKVKYIMTDNLKIIVSYIYFNIMCSVIKICMTVIICYYFTSFPQPVNFWLATLNKEQEEK